MSAELVTIPTVIASHTQDAPLGEKTALPPLIPSSLAKSGDSVALAGWGSSGLITNQADII
ncbi:MAG: hypothetical protein KME55_11110 [Nostoc indistinguendum CM1-VF10]|nr:hypothetical protein [Nostoc indistinguendum CM1-VF10]